MPHIQETVTEELDYDRFYQFPDQVTDITKAAGQRTWQLLHGLADHYPCPPCKPVFQTLASGIHDVVNVHLGKPVHDPRRFKAFVDLVKEAETSLQEKHRLHSHRRQEHVVV